VNATATAEPGVDEGAEETESKPARTFSDQLTFDLGKEVPTRLAGSVNVAGRLEVGIDIPIDEPVTVQILNAGGKVLASADAVCTAVQFVSKHPADEPAWTERKHTVKVEMGG
jgi:hypothetical protein